MKKIFSLALCLTLAVSMLAGCGSASTASASTASGASGSTTATAAAAKTLRLAKTADVTTMDPAKTSSDYMMPMNIFSRLFEIEKDGTGTKLVNSLVADYTVSDDGLVYDFTLVEGVTFSDGTPLTASDVKYSFTRMLNVDGAVNGYFLDCVAGASEVEEGTSTDLTGVEVVDDTHFTVTLSAPCAGFVYRLASPPCCILSESLTEAAGDQFGLDASKTIGTGAYVLESWVANSSMTLVRNENYFGEAPDVARVEITVVPDASTESMMYQNGEIDIMDLDLLDSAIVESTYKTAYADQIVTGSRLGITYFTMNENIAPFDDVKVRKAVQMAINRQQLLDVVYAGAGQVEDGIYPTGLIGFNADKTAIEYDPEGAKALLAEAGYADGFEMTINADSTASDGVMQMYQIIQQDLAAVGITVTIESLDEASWLDLRKSGEMGSFIATWTADFNDPDNFISTFYGNEENSKKRSLNYYNTEVMERVSAAPAIIDETERLAEYKALEEQIVMEDAAWVPLFSRQHLFAVSTNVTSYTPNWSGYSDFYFKDVTLAS